MIPPIVVFLIVVVGGTFGALGAAIALGRVWDGIVLARARRADRRATL